MKLSRVAMVLAVVYGGVGIPAIGRWGGLGAVMLVSCTVGLVGGALFARQANRKYSRDQR